MVIQAAQPASVWGWSEAKDEITVTFVAGDRTEVGAVHAMADEQGVWRAKLPPLPVGATGRLVVQSAKGEKREIQDVIVGEVWLCGGQSNMSFKVASAGVSPETLAEARQEATEAKGSIRYFMVISAGFDTPQKDVPGKWFVADADNVKSCSAVAWYFGFDLHGKLKMPIGLIVSAVGGTPAESWMPEAALDATSVAPALRKRYDEMLAKEKPEALAAVKEKTSAWESLPFAKRHDWPGGEVGTFKRWPSRLYNGMIAGLGNYAVRGVIWFQADGNILVPGEYGELIQALIKSWRQQWGSELPFYYVEMNDMHEAQAKPYEERREAMAQIREQQNAALLLPKTGVVAAIDLGRVNNPSFNAHFPVKKPVGDRLSNLALTEVYGLSLGEVYSPEFGGYSLEGDKVRLHFKHADGLRAMGDGAVKGFILQNAQGEWVWADGKIDGNDVLVWSASAPKPVDVRYAWASNPVISIENGAGLPLRPFRTKIKEFAPAAK